MNLSPSRRSKRASAVGTLVLGLFVAGLTSEAKADEGERIFSVYGGVGGFAAGVGNNDSETSSGAGASFGLDYERGLTRAVWFRLSAGGGLYTGRPASAAGQATVGLSYVFDILKMVPYGHIGIGGVALHLDRTPEADSADNGTELHPMIELGLGLDILIRDNFSYGLTLRAESFLDRTALFLVGGRISWRWGFF